MKYDDLSREELIALLNINETIVNAVPIGFCVTDEKGIFEAVNSHYTKIYGYSRDELIGKHFSIVTTKENRETLTKLHDKFIAEGCELSKEWQVKTKRGQEKTIAASAARIVGPDGKYKKVTYVTDITKMKEQEKELIEMNEILKIKALIDDLTGLYNYGEIMQRLKAEINRVNHGDDKLTIMMLDIDDFTNINNNYGHVIGDEVLAALAKKISQNIREMDIAGRHGGDEFLIIFPNTSLEEGKIIAERILEAIRKIDIKNAQITISAGLHQFDGEDADELVAKADKMLYKAKNADKNMIAY